MFYELFVAQDLWKFFSDVGAHISRFQISDIQCLNYKDETSDTSPSLKSCEKDYDKCEWDTAMLIIEIEDRNWIEIGGLLADSKHNPTITFGHHAPSLSRYEGKRYLF